MCGAWQPGGLWEMGSRKIPGFASPPFDGFAEFADRTATTDLAAAFVRRPSPAGRARGQWDESTGRCVPEPRMFRPPAASGSAGLDDPLGVGRTDQRLVDVGIAAQDAAVGQQRLDRRRIQRAGEVEALGELAAQRRAGDRAATTARRPRRSPTGGAPDPGRRWHSRAPRRRRRRRRRRRSRARS